MDPLAPITPTPTPSAPNPKGGKIALGITIGLIMGIGGAIVVSRMRNRGGNKNTYQKGWNEAHEEILGFMKEAEEQGHTLGQVREMIMEDGE